MPIQAEPGEMEEVRRLLGEARGGLEEIARTTARRELVAKRRSAARALSERVAERYGLRRMAQAEYSNRRRAAKLGVAWEAIDRESIYYLSCWRCGICGRKVNPLEASLDHIVPLSKGGGHIRTNVQLAHMSCNFSKGAKMSRRAWQAESLSTNVLTTPPE